MQRAVLSLWLFHLRAASVFLQRWVLSLPAFWGETPACCGRSWNKKGNWYPAAITALTSWSRLLGCTSKPSLEPFCTFPFLFSSSPFLSWWTLTSGLQMHKRAWSWGYRLQLQVTPDGGKSRHPFYRETTELQRQMCLACHCPRSLWLIHGESSDFLN